MWCACALCRITHDCAAVETSRWSARGASNPPAVQHSCLTTVLEALWISARLRTPRQIDSATVRAFVEEVGLGNPKA